MGAERARRRSELSEGRLIRGLASAVSSGRVRDFSLGGNSESPVRKGTRRRDSITTRGAGAVRFVAQSIRNAGQGGALAVSVGERKLEPRALPPGGGS